MCRRRSYGYDLVIVLTVALGDFEGLLQRKQFYDPVVLHGAVIHPFSGDV